jgi:hypothetical protein
MYTTVAPMLQYLLVVVFVAGNGTNNVVVLSPDGKNCRQILTKDDGLNEPCSLRINIERSELLVCNKNGNILSC